MQYRHPGRRSERRFSRWYGEIVAQPVPSLTRPWRVDGWHRLLFVRGQLVAVAEFVCPRDRQMWKFKAEALASGMLALTYAAAAFWLLTKG